MAKITCRTCANEQGRVCLVKKSSVSINKRRNCAEYRLAPEKVKAKQLIKTVKMGYTEKEAMRQEYKKKLKQLKTMGAGDTVTVSAPTSDDPKHPFTGDLSRFTSTAE